MPEIQFTPDPEQQEQQIDFQPETNIEELKDQQRKEAKQEVESELGSSFENPIPQSPLSPFERAAFGWADSMKEQVKFLEKKFGADNVRIEKMDDESLGFVVKDPTTKKTHLVDPAGFSDITGDLIQEAGKNFPELLGSTLAVTAVTAGAPVLLTVAAAGTGAALANIGKQGIRTFLEEHFPDALGADGPDSTEDSINQIGTAFLLGMLGEGTGKLLGGAVKLGARALGGAIKRVSNTPEGQNIAASLIEFSSGVPKPLARARVEDPLKTARFDEIAIKDVINKTDNIVTMQKNVITRTEEQLKAALRNRGKEYDAINAKASDVSFNIKEPILSFLSDLKDRQLIFRSPDLKKKGGLEIVPNLISKDKRVLGKLKTDITKVLTRTRKRRKPSLIPDTESTAKAQLSNKPIGIKDLDNMIRNIDDLLSSKTGRPDSKSLEAVIMKYRADLKNQLNQQLTDFSPELGKARAALDEIYGPAKELVRDLSKQTSDVKIDAFLRRMVRQDGTRNSELVRSISNLLGKTDPTDDILRMEAARRSTSMFTGFKFNPLVPGRFLPGTPRPVAATVTKVGQAKESGRQALRPLLPYLKEIQKTIKKVDKGAVGTILRDPKLVGALQRLVGQGVISEQEIAEDLMSHVR